MSLLKLLQEQTAENHDKTSIRETGEPHHYARGANISGTGFRRLDPINRQPTDAPRELTRTAPTVPPHLFPEDGDWKFTQPVRSSTVPKVDAIRDQALSLGWSEAQLYQNRGRFRFPCGQDYGLVCFLEEDKSHRRGNPPVHRNHRSAAPREPALLLQRGRGSTMAEDNGNRRLNRRYANARDVLPPELLCTVQQHFAGLLWVPAGTHLYAVRRKLVLALRDQGVHTQEIAQLAGVTTRRVRQILAQARDAEEPTHRSASR